MQKRYINFVSYIFIIMFFFTFLYGINHPKNYNNLQTTSPVNNNLSQPPLFDILKDAYPHIQFYTEYDNYVGDWKIQITNKNRTEILYYAHGKLLPKDELKNESLYTTFLYHYPKEVPNPKNFTENDINRILEFSNPKKRTENKGTSPFFYNFIYDVKDRIKTESHIKKMLFLGKSTNVHDFLHDKLNLVQNEIYQWAKKDSEVLNFINKIQSADSYSWRSISDSGKRSFHSMGLALDILPKGWEQKNLYWAWRRDIVGNKWMMLDLDRRWMPPKKVIEIFEQHGFIWGGKWIIWDNMHFEYRPEIVIYNNYIKK